MHCSFISFHSLAYGSKYSRMDQVESFKGHYLSYVPLSTYKGDSQNSGRRRRYLFCVMPAIVLLFCIYFSMNSHCRCLWLVLRIFHFSLNIYPWFYFLKLFSCLQNDNDIVKVSYFCLSNRWYFLKLCFHDGKMTMTYLRLVIFSCLTGGTLVLNLFSTKATPSCLCILPWSNHTLVTTTLQRRGVSFYRAVKLVTT